MRPEALAALHTRCFDDAPRPWTAAEFAALLADAAVVLVAGRQGFALGRVAGPEAELLTLAVAPEARRRGAGAGLLAAFEAMAAARGAREAFLEVAADNAPARRLYAAAGYAQVGRRPRYFAAPARAPVDALVLKKPIAGLG